MESKNKFIIAGVIILITILTFVIFGFGGIFRFIRILAIIIGIALFIGFIFWVVYTLFFKPRKVDIVALQSKKIKSSARICRPKHLRFLYLTGDRIHEQVKLGRIVGFTVITNFKGENEYIYTFKRFPPLFSWFEDENILRVSPEDSTAPIGDVYIRSLALLKISEYYYLNKDMLDIKRIDETIWQEAKRGLMFLTISEMKQIVDKAIGLDADHTKGVDNQKLIKTPKPDIAKPET